MPIEKLIELIFKTIAQIPYTAIPDITEHAEIIIFDISPVSKKPPTDF